MVVDGYTSVFFSSFDVALTLFLRRRQVLHIGNFFLLAFSVGCAFAPTANALIGFRFLGDFLFYSAVRSIVVWLIHCPSRICRQRPNCVWRWLYKRPFLGERPCNSNVHLHAWPSYRCVTFANDSCPRAQLALGPVVGPIAGGFIAQSIGTKYLFLITVGLCGIAAIIGLPLLRETYGPVVRRKHYARNSDPEGLPYEQKEQHAKSRILWLALSRPFVLLCRSFICFILSLYMAFMLGKSLMSQRRVSY